MANFCDFTLEVSKKCGAIGPKMPNFGTVGLKISIYAVAKEFIFTGHQNYHENVVGTPLPKNLKYCCQKEPSSKFGREPPPVVCPKRQ